MLINFSDILSTSPFVLSIHGLTQYYFTAPRCTDYKRQKCRDRWQYSCRDVPPASPRRRAGRLFWASLAHLLSPPPSSQQRQDGVKGGQVELSHFRNFLISHLRIYKDAMLMLNRCLNTVNGLQRSESKGSFQNELINQPLFMIFYMRCLAFREVRLTALW